MSAPPVSAVDQTVAPKTETLGVMTLVAFLFGRRAAIVQIARSPQAVWLGLIFVLSAGLAREYDGADLLHEPWHALLPVGASLGTSLLLFLLVTGVAKMRSGHSPLWPTYRQFLGAYWMTAPLAWLYAIPFERFLTPGEATAANLWLLLFVSVYRVALMTHVISVLWNCREIAAFFVVMLFADAVASAIVWLTPMPIFSIMGGVRLTESEQVIQGAMLLVRFFGAASLLLWFAGTVVIACHHDRGTSTWRLIDLSSARPTRVSKAFWSLAALSLLVWLPVLPQTQPEQIHARAMASELRGGDISQAIASLSRLRRTDFPPHWDPPPHVGYGEHNPPFFDLLELLAAPGIDAEIRALFLQKVTDDSPDHWPLRGAYVPSLDALSDAELRRLVELLKSLPEGPQVAASYRGEVSYVLRDDVSPSGGSPGPELSQERRALLETLRDIAPPEPEDDANAAIHGE